MPVLLIKDLPIICSKSEFLEEYRKLNNNSLIYEDYKFNISVETILNIHEERKKKDANAYGSKGKISFCYSNEEAKELVFELLLFFSFFYGKFDVIVNGEKISITDFFIPKSNINSYSNEIVSLKFKDVIVTVDAREIKLLKGNVNHFVIVTDQNLYYFSSTVYAKKGVQIIPNNFNKHFIEKDHSQIISDSEHILNSNRPSKRKLKQYRKNDILAIIN